MQLSADQQAQVAQWVRDGRSLSEIQTSIREEFDIAMTYMDVRFLVDDLDLELAEQAKGFVDDSKLAQAAKGSEGGAGDTASPAGTQGVSVELDRMVRPGAALSGSVTFSDGETANWFIDQAGAFGFEPSTDGYQPSQEDFQAFQLELRNKLGA